MLDSGQFREEAERIDEREYLALLDQHGATDARDVFPQREPFNPSDYGDDPEQEQVSMPADPLPEYRRSKQEEKEQEERMNRHVDITAYVGFYKFSYRDPAYWGAGYVPRFWTGDLWKPIYDLHHFREESDRISEAEFVAMLAQLGAPDP